MNEYIAQVFIPFPMGVFAAIFNTRFKRDIFSGKAFIICHNLAYCSDDASSSCSFVVGLAIRLLYLFGGFSAKIGCVFRKILLNFMVAL